MLMSLLPGPVRANGDGDVVLDWNAIMVTTVSGQNPFAQARFAAITQLAVFEAVNSITGDYEPYLGADRRAARRVRGGRCRGRRARRARRTTSRQRQQRSTQLGLHRSPRSPTVSPRTTASPSARRPPRR